MAKYYYTVSPSPKRLYNVKIVIYKLVSNGEHFKYLGENHYNTGTWYGETTQVTRLVAQHTNHWLDEEGFHFKDKRVKIVKLPCEGI